jgi:hypothetical protein
MTRPCAPLVAVSWPAVVPAADRDLKTGARRGLERSGFVIAVSRPNDHRRALIVEAVVAPPRSIVAVVGGEQQFAAQLPSQRRHGLAHTLAIASQPLAPVVASHAAVVGSLLDD